MRIVNVRFHRGGYDDWDIWEPALRSLYSGIPIYDPRDPGLDGLDGTPLDLHRKFTLDDDPKELAHYLETAGYLVVADVFERLRPTLSRTTTFSDAHRHPVRRSQTPTPPKLDAEVRHPHTRATKSDTHTTISGKSLPHRRLDLDAGCAPMLQRDPHAYDQSSVKVSVNVSPASSRLGLMVNASGGPV